MNKKRIISIIVALIIGTHLFIPSYVGYLYYTDKNSDPVENHFSNVVKPR